MRCADRIFDTNRSTYRRHRTSRTDRSIMELEGSSLIRNSYVVCLRVLNDLQLERRDRIWIRLVENVQVLPLEGKNTDQRTRRTVRIRIWDERRQILNT